ncbi:MULTISPECIES: LysR family transcriptional regulator [unclassified Aureimonas]|uniref:LysR family transcriptional regulator n=1 Tax=unclassified Aureimonas TaxID=2615206 RepID=UPI0006F6D8CB|nr:MULTISPECIES: LysR family transcriptional regulator [unclassified Aureimonas]KQT66190.1 LysR family transcriptional regulator [Aureimonas sp. Leaf427]KQT72378.1 LysR family transcriptional regulator [Aureimonas sp. Leaf460]
MDTLTRMRAFIAVIENEGFSAAARKTGRSKALLSKYVRELEDELGVLLINRTTRQIALTGAGEVYLSRASAILADLESLNEEAREATGEAKGRIRISAARTFGDAEFGRSLVDFAVEHPAISLDIHLDDNFVDLVEEGFDMAVRMTRLSDSAMIARRLAPLDSVLCASPDLVAKVGRPTHPNQLSDKPAVIDSNSRMFSNWTFRDPATGDPLPVAVSGQFTANSPVTVRAAVRAGLGFALIPEFVVRADIAAGRLVTVLDDYMPKDAGIYAVFPHRRHLPTRVRLLVDYLAIWFRKCDGAEGKLERSLCLEP